MSHISSFEKHPCDVPELAPLFGSLRCRRQPLCATFRTAPRTDCLRNVPALLSVKLRQRSAHVPLPPRPCAPGSNAKGSRLWRGRALRTARGRTLSPLPGTIAPLERDRLTPTSEVPVIIQHMPARACQRLLPLPLPPP